MSVKQFTEKIIPKKYMSKIHIVGRRSDDLNVILEVNCEVMQKYNKYVYTIASILLHILASRTLPILCHYFIQYACCSAD